MSQQKLVGRRGSMAARRASTNRRWSTDKAVDLAEEFAVKNAVINTSTRRATYMDMAAEGFGGLAKVQQAMENAMEMTIAGKTDENAPDFDANPDLMTNAQALLNLLNNCLGSALLSIGYAVSEMGLISGAIAIVFAGLMNRYTCLVALECSAVGGEDPATTAANERALGKPGKVIQLVVFFGIGFASMCSYLTASKDAILSFLDLAEIKLSEDESLNEKLVTVLVWFLLTFPPTLIRSLKSMATFSMIGFLGALIMVIGMIACSLGEISAKGIQWHKISLFPKDFASFIAGFPTIVMCMGVQASTGPILGGMQDSSDANINRQLNRNFAFVMSLFCIIGLSVYLAFNEDTKSDVLQVFPNGSPLGILTRVGALISVVLSYMVMMVPCKLSVIEALFGKNEALQEASRVQFYGTTIALNLLCLGMALVVSDLAIIFGFLSAFISPVLSWGLPCCAMMGMLALPEIEKRPWFSCKNCIYWLINLFGVSLCVMGTYTLSQLLSGKA